MKEASTMLFHIFDTSIIIHPMQLR